MDFYLSIGIILIFEKILIFFIFVAFATKYIIMYTYKLL